MFTMVNTVKRKRNGFTLVEVLVALAILAAIMSVIGMTTVQIFRINGASQNHALAIRQVQNAGQWISRDALQSNVAPVFGSVNGFSLTLKEDLTRYYGGIRTVTYSIVNGELRRTEGSQTLVIATGIQYSTDPLNINFNSTYFKRVTLGDVVEYELKITAVSGVGIDITTETRYYKIEPRPDNV